MSDKFEGIPESELNAVRKAIAGSKFFGRLIRPERDDVAEVVLGVNRLTNHILDTIEKELKAVGDKAREEDGDDWNEEWWLAMQSLATTMVASQFELGTEDRYKQIERVEAIRSDNDPAAASFILRCASDVIKQSIEDGKVATKAREDALHGRN